MTLWPALLLSLVAATAFALATALQHRAATSVGSGARSTVQMFRLLFRRVDWWVGLVISILGMGLRATALAFGSVAMVQSMLITSVVLGVVLRSRMDGRSPSRRELSAVVTTTFGIAVLATLVTLSGARGDLDHSRAVVGGATLVALAVVAWVGALVTAAHLTRARAYLFSIGAGACFGLTGGMLKAVALVAGHGPTALLSSPVLYLFAAGASLGAVLTHHAYRLAPLSVSMPTVNVVNVSAAMLFAWLAFGEAPASGAVFAGAEVVALLVVTAGLVQTGRAVASTEAVGQPVLVQGGARPADPPPAVAAA